MRGKNIIWLCFAAMLLSVLVVNVGVSKRPTTIELLPERIPAIGEGIPGDEYEMSLEINNVANLWSWGCEIHVRPYASVLNPSNFAEGAFLEEGWPADWTGGGTYLATNVDSLHGIIYLAASRLEKKDPWTGDPIPREGATGDHGVLLTFKFTVMEAGDSPIEIVNPVLSDINGDPIPHRVSGSYYYGPIAIIEQKKLNIPDVFAGEAFTINQKAKNEGDVPLYVRIRYDVHRIEDDRYFIISSGQTYFGGGLGEPRPYEIKYVNEFNEWYYEWVNPATNLFGPPDGSYIEGDTHAQWASLFGFEDITLAGREIAEITIDCYTQFPNGYYEGADIDLYGFSSLQTFRWLGSGWGTASWGWHGMRWLADSVLTRMPELADETEFNNLELLVYNYHGDTPDVMRVDSIRLTVEFANIVPVIQPYYVLLPGETLDSVVYWPSEPGQEGHYEVTCAVEYSYDLTKWNSWGSDPKHETFTIEPPEI